MSVSITFPEWVKSPTKCETRTHSSVFPSNFLDVHGAIKRVVTYEYHDVVTEWDPDHNITYSYFTNPDFPVRLQVKIGSETYYSFED